MVHIEDFSKEEDTLSPHLLKSTKDQMRFG